MIRLLLILFSLAGVALSISWLADRQGMIEVNYDGYLYQTSVFTGTCIIILLAITLMVLFWLLLGLINLPHKIAQAARTRRHNKGMESVTRGLLAVSAGEVRLAKASADTAGRLLHDAPLALLLQAQALQIAGQADKAEVIFAQMMELPETRLLALRGLYTAARQRGETQAALSFATEAQKMAPASWASPAVLDHYARRGQWERAIAALDSAYGHKLIDKALYHRQKAVLLTALAQEQAQEQIQEHIQEKTKDQSEHALHNARSALKLAPDLIPAIVLVARLRLKEGKMRAASKILEAGWLSAPHPDIAQLYIGLRSGDSAQERLSRAQKLLNLTPDAPEARLAFAHAAMDGRDYDAARTALAPLISQPVERPTQKVCLAMARLEDEVHQGSGLAREWLARAPRAPRDPAWIADNIISDAWAPLSPTTGKIDAFIWQTPAEQLSSPIEPLPQQQMQRLDAPTEPASELKPEADQASHKTVTEEHSEASMGPAFKSIPKPPTEAPLRGLELDQLRHFTAPDDPGPEDETRHS